MLYRRKKQKVEGQTVSGATLPEVVARYLDELDHPVRDTVQLTTLRRWLGEFDAVREVRKGATDD